MKIIIHGATGGSNFGDVLFADIFYKKLSEINPKSKNKFFELGFLGASNFLKEELNYTNSFSLRDIFNSDALVLISGGYFGERNGTLKENLFRFLRYFPVGLVFVMRRKPIYISGVGGGPLTNSLLRKSMKFLMDKARLVTVRDNETKNYFVDYGVKREITVTSDTAQLITKEMLPELDKNVELEMSKALSGKKTILLHLYGKEEIDLPIFEKVIPALKEFIKKNPEFGIVVSTDWEFDVSTYKVEDMFPSNVSIYNYGYSSSWQMCALIEKTDIIITPKLHVGILGSTFSKSVIAIPMHKEKTVRYYKQINESERCVALDTVKSEQIYNMLETYKDKNIYLSSEIINKANMNIELLQSSIRNL